MATYIPSDRKSYYKRQYQKHKEAQKAYAREYHRLHRDKILERKKSWRPSDEYKQKVSVVAKLRRQKNKVEVVNHYTNGKNCCDCCRESHMEFLTVEHIGGGGRQHRKTIKTADVCKWLIENNFPAGFRILCLNCNFSLGKFGYCPHQKGL